MEIVKNLIFAVKNLVLNSLINFDIHCRFFRVGQLRENESLGIIF